MTPDVPAEIVELGAEALRQQAYACDGNCGLSEQDCYQAHPINWSGRVAGETAVDGEAPALARAVIEAALPAAYRALAEQVLLASEIATGTRCAACHGKPASHRYPHYRCGCGHTWDITRAEWAHRIRAYDPAVLLRQIAETGTLPAIPTRGEQ